MRFAQSAALLLVLACGGDNATGPSTAQVGGAWTANWSNLNGGGLSCLVTGTHLQISQSGATFTGTYSGGTLSCNGSTFPPASGTIVNGSVTGQQVAFDLGDQSLHQSGTLSGNSMSGSAIWTTSLSGVVTTLTGTWSASR